jgi:hypothetical protein
MPLHILSDEDVQLVTVACVLSMEVYEIRCQKRYDFEKYFNRDLSGTNAEAYGTTTEVRTQILSTLQNRMPNSPTLEMLRTYNPE